VEDKRRTIMKYAAIQSKERRKKERNNNSMFLFIMYALYVGGDIKIRIYCKVY
jgi:hypothetical protein